MVPGFFPMNPIPGIRPFFHLLDHLRRMQGRFYDSVGRGPRETPSRTVLVEKQFCLQAYHQGPRAPGQPVLLIVPAPIKQHYLWDLTPLRSVVRLGLKRDIKVFSIRWNPPGQDTPPMGLPYYADRFILHCLKAIEREIGPKKVFIAGHSLGGTLAAIFAALHPQRVKGLILAGAPLNFSKGTGHIQTAVSLAPLAGRVVASAGHVPGSFLNAASLSASPQTFASDRWLDRQLSLADPGALDSHMLVERWSLDEMPMNARLFEQMVELLYRENRFMNGTLTINGRLALPQQVDMPLRAIVDERCRIVPPRSVVPFIDAVRSTDKQVLTYPGDIGVSVQHAGMLVGKHAIRHLWPQIMNWIQGHR
jgi:polyhydroxyalkanoate synthase subunit PhaC